MEYDRPERVSCVENRGGDVACRGRVGVDKMRIRWIDRSAQRTMPVGLRRLPSIRTSHLAPCPAGAAVANLPSYYNASNHDRLLLPETLSYSTQPNAMKAWEGPGGCAQPKQKHIGSPTATTTTIQAAAKCERCDP